jgi:mRNA-degrading endonuclease RelE of RelBE toxin-antitoxin system
MSYALAFKSSAEKELRKLSRDIIPRVVAAIQALGDLLVSFAAKTSSRRLAR